MSDDEYDVPGDFANLEGIDWHTVLGPPPPDNPESLSANSSHYSFDEMDQNAFAEVDTLERNSRVLNGISSKRNRSLNMH